MTEAAVFLTSLAQALARMSLYSDGHPARARAAELSFERLRDLQRIDPGPVFSFLGREVVYHRSTLQEMSDWDWAERLSRCGVQRMEFDGTADREQYLAFLEDVLTRISLQFTGSLARPEPADQRRGIRIGSVGLRESVVAESAGEMAWGEGDEVLPVDLTEEADAVDWIHREVGEDRGLAIAEAELTVASLGAAMRGERNLILPLLTLKDFDQYTTTHALNVSVLTMGLAEHLGLSGREVRAFGIAGLLHDLGKVRVPPELLRKPGALTEPERDIVRAHPVDGARIILQSDRRDDLCAVVAFEHHIMIDGGGYPVRRTRKDCHPASVVVHVCDVFDALRTHRPYRVGWNVPGILDYIERRIGTEFDADVARTFLAMVRAWELRNATAASIDAEVATPVP